MSHVAMFVLAFAAAITQLAILPALDADVLARPVLPVALLAGWCAMRRPTETWPVLLVTPMLMGPLSEERLGWFLIALIPSAAIGTALSPVDTPGAPPGLARRMGIAALIGLSGAIGHAAVLATAGGLSARLLQEPSAIAGGVAWTILFALAVTVALAPLRPNPRGLFA